MAILYLFKPIGKTPLEIVNDYKQTHNDVYKICYIGRLDPMASGKFIALTNEDCQKTNDCFGGDKKYIYEILVGISTDTLDLLGKITGLFQWDFYNKKQVTNFFNSIYIGKQIQEYPIYSSYKIKGRPLWWYAKNDNIDFELPTKEINIYRNTIVSKYKKSGKEIKNYINKHFNNIKTGDFDIKNIKQSWDIDVKDNYEFDIIKVESHVSSGTYIRKICQKLGEHLGVPCCAFSIYRSEINLSCNINE